MKVADVEASANLLEASQMDRAAQIGVSGCDARVITRYGTATVRLLDSK